MIGTIEQPRLEKIKAKLEQRLLASLRINISPIEKTLMHPDRPVVLAPLPEKFAKREVQFDRFGIDPHHVDEGVDRSVGLLTKQKIQAAKIT